MVIGFSATVMVCRNAAQAIGGRENVLDDVDPVAGGASHRLHVLVPRQHLGSRIEVGGHYLIDDVHCEIGVTRVLDRELNAWRRQDADAVVQLVRFAGGGRRALPPTT